VALSWPAVTGASHYRVYRGTSSDPARTTALTGWQTPTNHTDYTAVPGTGYFYWVLAAVDSAGNRASAFGAGKKGSRARDCNANGVPDQNEPDADDDGVIDGCDNCPGTPPGMRVDEHGCSEPIDADFDNDGDVDGVDYGVFAGCFNGTGNPINAGCEPVDLNGDQHVDGVDYGLFAGCFNGSGNPSDCARRVSAADLDRDGDVDGADFGIFAGCFNGTGNLVNAGCEVADLNADNSVDGIDYGIFASCFNGSGNRPACG
jgi:hypothetical protein